MQKKVDKHTEPQKDAIVSSIQQNNRVLYQQDQRYSSHKQALLQGKVDLSPRLFPVQAIVHKTPSKPNLRQSTNLQSIVIQRQITEENIGIHYELTTHKQGEVTVISGILKKESSILGYPQNILLKKGAGAKEDQLATIKLAGHSGVFNVITSGKEYFIREGYNDKGIHTNWKEAKPYAKKILTEAIDLSVHLLEKGIIDRDRKVYAPGPDGQMSLHNMVINKKNGATVHFFDFEPMILIDWSKPLSTKDKIAIEDTWVMTHTFMIRSFAKYLGADSKAEEARLFKAARDVLKKHEQSELIDKGEEESVAFYEDKIKIGLLSEEFHKEPKLVELLPLKEVARRTRIAEVLKRKGAKYNKATKKDINLVVLDGLIDQWLSEEPGRSVVFSILMKFMSKWRDEYRKLTPDWKDHIKE